MAPCRPGKGPPTAPVEPRKATEDEPGRPPPHRSPSPPVLTCYPRNWRTFHQRAPRPSSTQRVVDTDNDTRRTRSRNRRPSSAAGYSAPTGLAEVNLRLTDLASPSPAVMGSHSAAAAPQTTAVEIRVESRGASTRSSTCATVRDSEAMPRQRCSRSQLADQHEHSTPHPATPGSDHPPRRFNHKRQPRTSRNDLRLTEAHHLRH